MKYNIFDLIKRPPEFFPDNLLPFGEPGNGDYICLDYSAGGEPKVVLWCHENNPGSDIAVIAENFDKFMSILKKSYD